METARALSPDPPADSFLPDPPADSFLPALPARPFLPALPTPLHRAPRLSEELGTEVWLKRDDLTGLGLGGNKARPAQYLLADAERRGADHFVTGGGPSSNWVLTAATGAMRRGLRTEVVLFGDGEGPEPGCLRLLRRLPGVRIVFTGDPVRASVDPVLERRAEEIRERGGSPYVVGRGGASPVGALGYIAAVDEIDSQLADLQAGTNAAVKTVWLAVGSCGTMAGLVAGHSRTGAARRITGVSVHRSPAECRRRVAEISEGALDLLSCPPSRRRTVQWEVRDGLSPDPGRVRAAVELMMRTEGIFLDDEFGGPALAALLAFINEGEGEGEEDANAPVLFLVTGGAPALFDEMAGAEVRPNRPAPYSASAATPGSGRR